MAAGAAAAAAVVGLCLPHNKRMRGEKRFVGGKLKSWRMAVKSKAKCLCGFVCLVAGRSRCRNTQPFCFRSPPPSQPASRSIQR